MEKIGKLKIRKFGKIEKNIGTYGHKNVSMLDEFGTTHVI